MAVTQGQDIVEEALRPFNEKRYDQDLEALCERVNAVPRLLLILSAFPEWEF